MPDIGYRCEAYGGSGERDLARILQYEIAGLGNESIVDGLVERGLVPALMAETFRPDENSGRALAGEIRRNTGMDLRFGLWLADLDEVAGHYAEDGDEIVDAYEMGLVIADLGGDGVLCAYAEEPAPFESMSLAEWRERESKNARPAASQ